MTKKMRELLNALEKAQNKSREILDKEDATLDEIKSATDEMGVIKAKIDALKEVENLENQEDEEDFIDSRVIDNTIQNEKDITIDMKKNAFINSIKEVVGEAKVSSEERQILNATTMTEGVPEDGGLTVPQDIRTEIKELRRSYPDALENYVNVETVSTLTGSRVIEKEADYTPFDNVDEASDFPEFEGPQFENIEYKVKKKGGVLKFSRELLQDTSENILAYVKKWTHKKGKATRNALIIKKLNDDFGKSKHPIKTLDDLKDVYNVKLDPAFKLTSIAITNQDGFNFLDKLKDKDGKYILQPNPTDATKMLLFGRYPIIEVSNKTLKTETGKAPIFCGDLKEAITIFDREALFLEFNDKSDSTWSKDLMAMKARERLDIKSVDKKAVVYGEIEIASTPEV